MILGLAEYREYDEYNAIMMWLYTGWANIPRYLTVDSDLKEVTSYFLQLNETKYKSSTIHTYASRGISRRTKKYLHTVSVFKLSEPSTFSSSPVTPLTALKQQW